MWKELKFKWICMFWAGLNDIIILSKESGGIRKDPQGINQAW